MDTSFNSFLVCVFIHPPPISNTYDVKKLNAIITTKATRAKPMPFKNASIILSPYPI